MQVHSNSESAKHVLQFYGGNDRSLVADVSRYLAAGLKQGDGTLVIAASERIEAFIRMLLLRAECRDAMRAGRLACLDAQGTLAQIMVDGQPQWDRFEHVVGGVIQAVQRQTGHAKLRIYGEMVDLLWKAGQFSAAIRVEECWNTLLDRLPDCHLFCAYSIDIFSPDFEPATVAPILGKHTRLLALGEALELSLGWAVDEVLGPRVEEFRRYDGHSGWAAMPRTVATLLWLKDKYPDAADEVLRRTRNYYEL